MSNLQAIGVFIAGMMFMRIFVLLWKATEITEWLKEDLREEKAVPTLGVAMFGAVAVIAAFLGIFKLLSLLCR